MVGGARLANVRAIAPLLVPGVLEKAAVASYEKATAALGARQFATAINEFERLKGLYPQYRDSEGLLAQARQLEAERQAENFYQIGMQHVQQGNFREAYFKFESALNQVSEFKDTQLHMKNALEKATYRVAVYPFKTAVMGANTTLFQQALTTNLMQDKSIFVEYVDQHVINRLFASQGTNFGVIDPMQTLSAARNENIRVVVFGDLPTAIVSPSQPRIQSKTAYTALTIEGKVVGRGPRQTYYIISQSVRVHCDVVYKIVDTQTGSVLHFGTVRENLSDEVEYAEYHGDEDELMSKVYKDESEKITRWRVVPLRESRFNARSELRNPDEIMNEALKGLGEKIAREINGFVSSYSATRSQ